jgi:formaldehyde-activating enzyme involved in methanogenesis
VKEKKIDHEKLFEVNRAATAKAIAKAMRIEPSIDWLLKNQDSVKHCFHEMGVNGQL